MQPALHLILAALGIFLIAATLPLFLELLVLSVAAAIPASPEVESAGVHRSVSVVIPAHNEEKLIAQCVASLGGASNVFVVAHNCTDATADRALDAGATVLLLNDTVGGKGTALDFGFRKAIAAGADILLVIDADSVAGPGLINAVAAAFARGAQAVQSRYEVANPETTPRTRLAALAFLGMNVLRPLGRHRLGLSSGIFGNGFALSASTLQQVPYTPNSLVEDLEYHLHLIRSGIRVHFLNEAAVFGEMPAGSAAAASQRARWEGGRILMRRQWTVPLATEVLKGHFRMLEPLLDLLAVPLATEAAFLAVLLAVGLSIHSLPLALYAGLGFGTLIFYVLIAASLAEQPWQTLRALAAAPGFLLFKLLMVPRTRLAARRDAAWVRTERNAESPDDPQA